MAVLKDLDKLSYDCFIWLSICKPRALASVLALDSAAIKPCGTILLEDSNADSSCSSAGCKSVKFESSTVDMSASASKLDCCRPAIGTIQY